MTEGIIDRAHILIQQKKYVEAEKLLKDVLSVQPNDVYVLMLLSEVNLQLDKIEAAEILINSAIGIDPERSHLFYIKAKISLQKGQYDEAEANIQNAVALDSSDAHSFALWASIKLNRKQYQNALDLANQALELDAENILGLNIRSTALMKLDKKEESFATIEGALREDPYNAYTHANYGWNLLEKGNHKKALEHFRESLKIDPNYAYAQSGMAEALKATNIVYRLFLKYAFWIQNLTAKYQWGVILGFYFGSKLLRSLADSNETLKPYLSPLITLLAIIAFSTWVITPLSNLFLRLNKFGKHLLDKNEIMSSNFVGVSCLVFLAGTTGYLVFRQDIYLAVAVFGFAMMVPYSVMFSPSKYKYSLLIYAAVMTLVGLVAIATVYQTGELFNGVSSIFLFGFVVFQWVANFLIIKQSNL